MDYLNFSGKRHWAMPIYHCENNDFVTNSIEDQRFNITINTEFVIENLKIVNCEEKRFIGYTLKLRDDSSAFMLNSENKIVGGIFASKKRTKRVIEGSELDTALFFARFKTHSHKKI